MMFAMLDDAVGLGDANETTIDSLDSILAIAFWPFHTQLVDIADMRSIGAVSYVCSVDIDTVDSPCDRLDFYRGTESRIELKNVLLFLEHNDLMSYVSWRFDVVVVVGRNRLSGVAVDVPMSMYPWVVDTYGVAGSDYLRAPVIEIVSEHVFTTPCERCFHSKTRCHIGRRGGCGACGGAQCVPRLAAEIQRDRTVMAEELMKTAASLCPLLQMLVATVGTRYGYCKGFTAGDKSALTTIVRTEIAGVRAIRAEAFIRNQCREYQLVVIEDGDMTIIDDMSGRRLGFKPINSSRGRLAVGSVFPSFGMSSPEMAIAMLNSAAKRPGAVLVTDANVRDQDFLTSTSRIMILCSITLSGRAYMMAGWV